MPDNLHFLLMKCFHHSNKAIVKKNTALSLLPGQGKVLECLMEEDGLFPKDLGVRCVIDKSTITSLLSKMEKQGFIMRTNDSKDKRAVRIWLTDTGKMLGEKAIKNGQDIDNVVLKSLSQKQRDELENILKIINNAYEEINAVESRKRES